MDRKLFLWFVVALVVVDSVLSKEICDMDDVACTTKAKKNIYKSLVSGINGLFKPIDPVYVEKFKGNFVMIQFVMTNVTLTGMRNCDVVLSKWNKKNMTYEYHLQCPQLVFDYNYHDKGILDSVNIDIEGSAVATVDDYSLIFKGNYMTSISETDQKPHITFKDYKVESDFKGNINIEGKELTHGNQDQIDLVMAYLYANFKEVKRVLHSSFIESLMAVFTKTLDTYLKTYPMDEVLLKN